MKKNQILYLLLFVVTISFVAGCKKKEDPAPTPPSRSEMLAGSTSKSWLVTSATAANLGNLDVLAIVAPQACNRDNLFVFYKTDNKLEIREGATKCNSGDPDLVATGSWSLSSDGNTLTINSGGGSPLSGNITITEMTNTTIKGTVPYTYMGTPITVNVTLTAQ